MSPHPTPGTPAPAGGRPGAPPRAGEGMGGGAAGKEGRRYPDRPIVGVLAVVLRGERVLVVRRANPPMPGRWGFPGGVLELGETVAQGAMRELHEETGVIAEAIGPLTVIDTIDRDNEGRVRFQDRNITRLPMHKRARLGIGYLTQEPSVFRKHAA